MNIKGFAKEAFAPIRQSLEGLDQLIEGSALVQMLPPGLRSTVRLRAFGLLQVPVLFFLSPTVMELSEDRCSVKVPLTYRSKNHWGSMYFGALAAGADCAGGLLTVHLIDRHAAGKGVGLIFKDFHAEFLKRAEGDVTFTCEDSDVIRECIAQVLATGERQSAVIHVTARVPEKHGDEAVAKFSLTLSLKARKTDT